MLRFVCAILINQEIKVMKLHPSPHLARELCDTSFDFFINTKMVSKYLHVNETYQKLNGVIYLYHKGEWGMCVIQYF